MRWGCQGRGGTLLGNLVTFAFRFWAGGGRCIIYMWECSPQSIPNFAYICIISCLNKRLGGKAVVSSVGPHGDNTLFGGEGQAKLEPWILNRRQALSSCYIKQLNTSPESRRQRFGRGGESTPGWLNLNLSLKCPESSFTSSTESFTEVPWLTDSTHPVWKVSPLDSQRPSQAHAFKGH